MKLQKLLQLKNIYLYQNCQFQNQLKKHCLNKFDSINNDPYNVGLSSANLTKRELAEKIKNGAISVIQDEQRPGGLLYKQGGFRQE